MAPQRGRAPRELAEEIAQAVGSSPSVERAEVAGAGFVNVWVAPAWYRDALAELLEQGQDYGSGWAAPRERFQVEMVSANPTGPITVASGRNAAYGDSVARLLAFAGHDVEREYYYNDSGAQMDRFRASVDAVRRGEQPPEDGYQGEYIAELAAIEGDPVPPMRDRIEASLERFRVHFDSWALQSALEQRLPELLPRLDTYEKDGAIWARSSAYGDDDDRVLIRSDGGAPTYRAADVVYLVDKLDRGFDHALYVLGADHHGTRNWYGAVRAHARLRPRARRGAALPARPPEPRGRADEDVEAARRRRVPRRLRRGGRDRRRRAGTSSRVGTTRRSRSTSTSRARSPRRTRCTTCSTRTPGSRGSCGTRATRSPRPTPTATSPARSVSSSSGSRSSRASSPRRPSAARRTRFRRTRSVSRTTSTASTTITAWSAAGTQRRSGSGS
jgi:hypothetical protein